MAKFLDITIELLEAMIQHFKSKDQLTFITLNRHIFHYFINTFYKKFTYKGSSHIVNLSKYGQYMRELTINEFPSGERSIDKVIIDFKLYIPLTCKVKINCYESLTFSQLKTLCEFNVASFDLSPYSFREDHLSSDKTNFETMVMCLKDNLFKGLEEVIFDFGEGLDEFDIFSCMSNSLKSISVNCEVSYCLDDMSDSTIFTNLENIEFTLYALLDFESFLQVSFLNLVSLDITLAIIDTFDTDETIMFKGDNFPKLKSFRVYLCRYYIKFQDEFKSLKTLEVETDIDGSFSLDFSNFLSLERLRLDFSGFKRENKVELFKYKLELLGNIKLKYFKLGGYGVSFNTLILLASCKDLKKVEFTNCGLEYGVFDKIEVESSGLSKKIMELIDKL